MQAKSKLRQLSSFGLAINAMPAVGPAGSYQVQLTVWNMTAKTIRLQCWPKDGVTMEQRIYDIKPDDSPAILLTADHYGKLLGCNIADTVAAFEYTAIGPNKERVEISAVPEGEPNFHYNPSYPGAFTYK